MTQKEFLALYYGLDKNMSDEQFYKRIEYINNIAKEELKKWKK